MFPKQSVSYLASAILLGFFLAPVTPVFAVQSHEVTTYAATNICQGGGTLNGYVNPFFSIDTMRWFEWGTSRDNLPNATNATRNGNNTEYFQQDIFNLVPNATYYFRVAAQNSKGAARGEILSFRAAGAPCPTVTAATPVSSSGSGTGAGTSYAGGVTVSQSVITKPTTDITNTTAKLNAVALPVGFVQTFGWFEWGRTPDMGYTTARRSLGANPSIPWSETISGLTSGTTYFLKPVIENQNGITDGALFSFRTTGVSPVVSAPVAPAEAVKKPSAPKTETKPVAAIEKKDTKTIEVLVIPDAGTASPGERIKETVQFENTTGVTMKETVVRVVIPCDTEYVATGSDPFLQTGTLLTRKVGDVKPKEIIKLTVWLETSTDAADKTPLETIAVVNWDDKANPSYTQSVGKAVVSINKDKVAKENVASASVAKESFSFFPINLKDWAAIIGVLLFVFAFFMIFLVMRKKDDEESVEDEFDFSKIPDTDPVLGMVGVPQKKSDNDPFITPKTIHNEVVVPLAPMKKNVSEKGAPPENLPV